jgi:acyl-CoA reductase-like NAD-dependent aldehyde dehydrogenase
VLDHAMRPVAPAPVPTSATSPRSSQVPAGTDQAPTDPADLTELLGSLADRAPAWAAATIAERIDLLRRVRDLVAAEAPAWVATGVALKGLDPAAPLVGGEEWLGGPYPTAAWLTEMIGTLERLGAGADPLQGVSVRTRRDGQVLARVFPATTADHLLLNGYEIDVWMQTGVTPPTLRDTVATAYRTDPAPGVTLVLGAGNVSAIPILDALYCLFADLQVVVLKMNPVNEAYGPVFERVLAPLVAAGYLAITYGGAEVGERLTHSTLVDSIHITGSERTYDAIVWGPGQQSRVNKAAGTKVVTKPVRAELGGVGPTIVVPGPWTPEDIAYQAQHLATQKLFSAGHTCVASQVLILSSEWRQADALLDALRGALADAPAREPFYPGTRERQAAFREANPAAEGIPGPVERTLLTGVDPTSDHPGFREELFGPVYLTTSLQVRGPGAFLRTAVAFANERLHGNLGANILIHPQTAAELGDELEDAIAALRYGCIGVNVWSAFAFLAPRAAWGAFPGNPPEDISSGVGVVHNALLFDRSQKTVAHAPFRPFQRSWRHPGGGLAVKPPWFLDNRTAQQTAARFTAYAADPRPTRIPAIAAAAVRG